MQGTKRPLFPLGKSLSVIPVGQTSTHAPQNLQSDSFNLNF